MKGAYERFSHDNLTIEVIDGPTVVGVMWHGVSDVRDPATLLVPYLNQLADQLGKRKVTLDFRKFEYMNSATVSPILQFVKRLDTNGAQVVVRYDARVNWQRVNFLCMKTIARTLSHVQVEGS